MEAILRVLARLAGIVILVIGVRGIIPYVVAFKQGDAMLTFDQVGFAGQSVIIIIGLILALFPGAVGTRSLVIGAQDKYPTPLLDADDVSRVLIAIVGLYFFADGLVNFAYYLAFWSQYQAQAGSAPLTLSAPADLVAGTWSTAVELLVGVSLLAASGRVARLLKRIRQI